MKRRYIPVRRVHIPVPLSPCSFYHELQQRVLPALVLCLLIQTLSTDVYAGLKIIQWTPFQIKMELMLISSKSNNRQQVMISGPFVNVQPRADIRMEPADLINPLHLGIDQIPFPTMMSQPWLDDHLHEDILPTLSSSAIGNEGIFSSDIYRDNLYQGQLHAVPSGSESAIFKNGSSMNYFKLSFFNRDMKYINRDASERDIGRYSKWEMLMSPTFDLRHQPFMETMGKVFEPKVELEIQF